MKQTFTCILTCILLSTHIRAQQAPTYTPAMRETDSLIIASIINPAVNAADEKNETPDWKILTGVIIAKYDSTYADRTVTKARIYYYYGKDWALFATAIVHYTVAYEDKGNAKLMNRNAQFILQYSQKKDEWQTALEWMKGAIKMEPDNADYRATYEALLAKTITG